MFERDSRFTLSGVVGAAFGVVFVAGSLAIGNRPETPVTPAVVPTATPLGSALLDPDKAEIVCDGSSLRITVIHPLPRVQTRGVFARVIEDSTGQVVTPSYDGPHSSGIRFTFKDAVPSTGSLKDSASKLVLKFGQSYRVRLQEGFIDGNTRKITLDDGQMAEIKYLTAPQSCP